MRLRKVPPAGTRVSLSSQEEFRESLSEVFRPYSWHTFGSGTAALAAALLIARSRKSAFHPEVLIPAYGCPDLVSAAKFARLRIRLIDFVKDKPWMDLDRVESVVSKDTVAIVATNFLGIPEQVDELRGIANRHDLLLIEDSAQGFPAARDDAYWRAETVVLSFGRGKPVSLLGGGALLLAEDVSRRLLGKMHTERPLWRQSAFAMGVKSRVYNLLIGPKIYWFTDLLPFLDLGTTKFKSLAGIHVLHEARLPLLAAGINRYQSEATLSASNRTRDIASQLAEEGLVESNLPENCELSTSRVLLRYPLLLDCAVKDGLSLKRQFGQLGLSDLYKVELLRVDGVRQLVKMPESVVNAADFAKRLVTLPTHSNVSSSDMESILDLFRSVQ